MHEAGYDAFMTGVVFGTFAKYIEIGNILKNVQALDTSKND